MPHSYVLHHSWLIALMHKALIVLLCSGGLWLCSTNLRADETIAVCAGPDLVVASKDGGQMALVPLSARNTIEVWDLPATKKKSTFADGQSAEPITRLWLSPDGSTLAALIDKSHHIILWDVSSEKRLGTIELEGQAVRMGLFSGNGRRFTAVCEDESLQWERDAADTVKRVQVSDVASIMSHTVSAKGRLAAVVTRRGLEVWDTSTLQRTAPLEYESSVQSFFTHDEEMLLCVKESGKQYQIDVWMLPDKFGDPAFGRTISGLAGKAIAVAPDSGSAAFATQDGTVVRIESLVAKNGRDLGKPSQFGERSPTPMRALAYSADGRTLVSAVEHVLRIWNVASATVIGEMRSEVPIDRVWCGAGGKKMVCLDVQNRLILRTVGASLKPIPHRTFDYTTSAGYSLGFRAMDFTSDGRTLAVALGGTDKVVLINAIAGKELGSLKFSPFRVRFSRDGQKLLLLGEHQTAVYDMELSLLTAVKGHSAATSPHDHLLCARIKQKVAFWDAATGKVVQTLQPDSIADIFSCEEAISRDGKKYVIMASPKKGNGRSIEVMDITTGRSISTFPLDRVGLEAFSTLRFSPDGSYLLLATSGAIAVIDYRNQEAIRSIELQPTKDGVNLARTLTEHSGNSIERNPVIEGPRPPLAAIDYVECMDVASTGVIATASGGYVDLWDYETGRYLESVENKNMKIERLTFSSDGSRLAYVQDKTVHILDLSQFISGLEGDGKSRPAEAPSRKTSRSHINERADDRTAVDGSGNKPSRRETQR